MLRRSFCWLVLLLSCSRVRAHHGQDFFLIEDWELPAPGHGQMLATFDWEKSGSRDVFTSEPGISFVPFSRLGISLLSEFSAAGDDLRFSSVSPRFQIQLTPPAMVSPLRISFSAGRTIHDGALGRETYTQTILTPEYLPAPAEEVTVTVPAAAPVEEPPCDPSIDVDCVPRRSPRHGGHAGPEPAAQVIVVKEKRQGKGRKIYRRSVRRLQGADAQDDWNARLVIEGDIGPVKAVVNLTAVLPDDSGVRWQYAAGVRCPIAKGLAAGIECAGDFRSNGEHEALAGIYWTPVHDLTLRCGVGTVAGEGPDLTLRTGIVWRF